MRGAGVLLAVLLCAQAGKAASPTAFTALSSVSVPEIPAKAAELVRAAASSDREQTARDILRDVTLIARPGVLPYVVSAICRSNPETSEAAVATAIILQPQDTLFFCKAALCAAPSKVEEIVFSACQVAPSACANVAMVAYRECPYANNLIFAGLARGRPDLKLYLEEAAIQFAPNDFDSIIRKAVQLFSEAPKPPPQ
jgi:hypothetical protein